MFRAKRNCIWLNVYTLTFAMVNFAISTVSSNSNQIRKINLCCSYAHRLVENRCEPSNDTLKLPPLYDPYNLSLIDETPLPDRYFNLSFEYSCSSQYYASLTLEEEFMFLSNGSLYLYNASVLYGPNVYGYDEYCFDIAAAADGIADAKFCYIPEPTTKFITFGLFVSPLFLFLTFIVYTVIPELKNMHGRTLRGYAGSLTVAYVSLGIVQITPEENVSNNFCYALAFITHFFFLASFFWLNVMCFDIWWTFGGFRSLQGSMHQRERKKFLIYSIYAWGCASLITGICAIMDFLPIIPDYFVKPEFGHLNCWFKTKMATAIYFYGPMGVTVLCNICLFVSTALKIVKHKRDTAHHLRGVDSRRHDDNKQWFNLYLKLFIVMGINWSMEIISWLFDNSPEYLWYITDLTNTLQGVIIFLIFVCKKKIRRLLLKRYGCQGNNILSRNSTRSGYHSSAASRTCTTSAAAQEKITSICLNEPFRCRPTIDK